MSDLVGRLMRLEGGTWRPIGDPLPPFANAPPKPQLFMAPWVLPKDLAPRPYDVLVIGELAHQLLTRCEEDDPLYLELAEQTLLLNDRDVTRDWLAAIEVWVGRRLDPGDPWPTPPAGPSTR